MNLQLRAHDSIGHSLAFPLFLRGWAELVDNGWVPGGINFGNDTQVLYVQDLECPDAPVVGFLTYTIQRNASTAWVLFYYTVEAYRRRGVLSMLHADIEDRARRMGLRHLAANIHQGNAPSLAAASSLGYSAEFTRVHRNLKP